MPRAFLNTEIMLKDFVELPLAKLLNNEIALVKLAQKKQYKWEGRQIRLPVHTGRNFGSRAGSAAATLATAGQQTTVNATIDARFNRGRMQIDGPSIAASLTNRGAFENLLEFELEGLKTDCKVNAARQLNGHQLGALCQVHGVVGTTVTVKSQANTPTRRYYPVTTRYLTAGLPIVCMTAAGASATTSAATVASVTSSTVFEISDATGVAADDIVVLGEGTTQTNGSTNAYNVEIGGIAEMLENAVAQPDASANTYEGIDPDTTSGWIGFVRSTDGTTAARTWTLAGLTLSMMQRVITGIEVAGGESPDMIYGHPWVRDAYLDQLTPDVRFVAGKFAGGSMEVGFAGQDNEGKGKNFDMIWSKDAPYYSLAFLRKEHIEWFVMKDWHFLDDGGILRRVGNSDAQEATYMVYANFGTRKRNAHGMLVDINHTIEA